MTTTVWYSQPVFLSSTFKDMQAERDHLRDVVFPELERRMNARKCHLETVDLRWGVETVTSRDQEQKELTVLKVCLDEIERCRPFLIVILGDRYGWVPPEHRMKAAVNEKGYETDIAGKSVTALEIEYGVFANPDQKSRSLFYFRKIEHYNKMPSDLRQVYSDKNNPDPDVRAGYIKLQDLKARIEADDILKHKTKRYSTTWENNQLGGLETWGEQVLEDIWRELDEETKEHAAKIDPTWQGQERSALEEFVELRSRDFVGRENLLQELKKVALSKTEADLKGLCLQGGPGSGKSAVFAKLKRELETQPDTFILAHAAGISPRSINVDAFIRRWIQELARYLELSNKDPSKDLESFDKKKELFANLLLQAAIKTRVICLIDALNQFDHSIIARHLTWLPELWPKNARLIVTSIPGDATDAFSKRHVFQLIDMPKLEEKEADEIVKVLCKRYHKTPHTDVIKSLTQKKHKDGTQASGNPLWLKIAVEHLLLMDEDDFIESEKLIGTPEEKLHQFMMQISQGFPPEIGYLYDSLLKRAHERFGRRQGIKWIPMMLDFIAASRYGLRETDIRSLLKLDDYPLFDLQFASVRRYLRAHLAQSGEKGLWDFTHTQVRLSLKINRLSDGDFYQKCHRTIADHFETLPREDLLRSSEIMYHLMEGDEKKRSLEYYGGRLTAFELSAATNILGEAIILGQRDENNSGLEWVISLLGLFGTIKNNTKIFANICKRIGTNLIKKLNHTAMKVQITLLKENRLLIEKLLNDKSEVAKLTKVLSCCLTDLGHCYLTIGFPDSALECFEKDLEITEKLTMILPNNKKLSKSLAVSYKNLGLFYANKDGQFQLSLDYSMKALKIAHDLFNISHTKENGRLLSDEYMNLGTLYLSHTENHAKSIDFIKKSLTILSEISNNCQDINLFRDLMMCHSNLGRAHFIIGARRRALKNYQQAMGDDVFALDNYIQAVKFGEKYCAKFPDFHNCKWILAHNYNNIGDYYLNKNPEAALGFYKKTLEISEEIFSKGQGNLYELGILCGALHNVGLLCGELGNQLQKIEHFNRIVEIAGAIVLPQQDKNIVNILYNAMMGLAFHYFEVHNQYEALENLHKAFDISIYYYNMEVDSVVWSKKLINVLFCLGTVYQNKNNEKMTFYFTKAKDILLKLQQQGIILDNQMKQVWSDINKNILLLELHGADDPDLTVEINEQQQKEPSEKMLALRNRYLKTSREDITQSVPVEIPIPHPAADPVKAAQLNVQYQKELAFWKALPWWKRLKTKKPDNPRET